MLAADQRIIETEIDFLINNSLYPTKEANGRRRKMFEFLCKIAASAKFKHGHEVKMLRCGSSFLKTYLPESDLDIVLVSQNNELHCLTSLLSAFCEEIYSKTDLEDPHTIRNVEFVNARTKVLHCLVNNIGVDMTVNQLSALKGLTFLEEADRVIGQNHLFKRSLLLIKVLLSILSYSYYYLIHYRLGAYMIVRLIQGAFQF